MAVKAPELPGEWTARCELCNWSGKSTALLDVDETKFHTPQLFLTLADRLAREISPAIGKLVLSVGILPRDPSSLPLLQKVLQTSTRAIVTAVMLTVLQAPGDGQGGQ